MVAACVCVCGPHTAAVGGRRRQLEKRRRRYRATMMLVISTYPPFPSSTSVRPRVAQAGERIVSRRRRRRRSQRAAMNNGQTIHRNPEEEIFRRAKEGGRGTGGAHAAAVILHPLAPSSLPGKQMHARAEGRHRRQRALLKKRFASLPPSLPPLSLLPPLFFALFILNVAEYQSSSNADRSVDFSSSSAPLDRYYIRNATT